jgi:chromosome segregation ATPase
MTEFDALRAVHEELTAMADILATLRRRENAAEMAMGQAETELNAIRKLRGYCEIEIARLRQRLAQLEAEKTL